MVLGHHFKILSYDPTLVKGLGLSQDVQDTSPLLIDTDNVGLSNVLDSAVHLVKSGEQVEGIIPRPFYFQYFIPRALCRGWKF